MVTSGLPTRDTEVDEESRVTKKERVGKKKTFKWRGFDGPESRGPQEQRKTLLPETRPDKGRVGTVCEWVTLTRPRPSEKDCGRRQRTETYRGTFGEGVLPSLSSSTSDTRWVE